MTVRALIEAWSCGRNAVVCVATVGNSYGEDIRRIGGVSEMANGRFANSEVLGFVTDCVDGVHRMAITVNANTVPVCVLRGWEE